MLINLRLPFQSIWATDLYSFENIGLQYIAGTLREKDYSVKIIDMESLNLSFNDVLKKVEEYKPILIGMSPSNATMENSITLAKRIKKKFPHIHITLGGHHATFAAKEILIIEDCFNSVVRGEGEETIVELVRQFKDNSNLHKVKGLVYRDNNGKIKENSERQAIEKLDSIPMPVRDVLEEGVMNGKPQAARMITSRGCNLHCTFCTTPAMVELQNAFRWRHRSAEDVVNEMELLKNRYNVEMVFINDDDFIGPGREGKSHVEQLVQLMIDRQLNMRFRIQVKPSDINQQNRPLLDLLTKKGLESVLIGAESGSPKVLKRYKKYSTVLPSLRASQLLKEYNIQLEIGFMMFDPYSTFEELYQNLSFLEQINQLYLFRNLSIRMGLFPGTEMLKQAKKDELVPDNWYKSSYSYKFKDVKIGRLSDVLLKIHSFLTNLDKLLFDLDLEVCRAKRGLIDFSLVEINSFIKATRALQRQTSNVHKKFFLEACKLSEMKKFKELSNLCSGYLTSINEIEVELSKLWKVVGKLESSEVVSITTRGGE